MITTLIAFAVIGAQQPKLVMNCVVTGEEIETPAATYNYKGAKYGVCCGGCSGPFSKNPEKFLDPEKMKDNRLVGVSYFDPVSGLGVKADKAAAGPSKYMGVAYYFTSVEDQKTFDADPKKYTTLPKKEALYCPVMKRAISDVSKSGGFADVDGVRYYICCSPCAAELAKEPAKYLDTDAAKYVQDIKIVSAKQDK
jgi:YHS domain-containing protein